jgi:hypothetical protein
MQAGAMIIGSALLKCDLPPRVNVEPATAPIDPSIFFPTRAYAQKALTTSYRIRAGARHRISTTVFQVSGRIFNSSNQTTCCGPPSL